MRFFIALEIPEPDREKLKRVQNRLQNLLPSVRLTNPLKLHLTLVFVGEQPLELKAPLTEIMNQASLGIEPFQVTPSFLDGFPNIHHPHTFFVGVKGDVDKLQLLRERIKDGLRVLKLPVDERRFIPHIAIAKANHLNVSPEQEASLQNLIPPLEPIRVSSIKLFESVPEGGLHKHNTLAEIRL